MARKRKKDPREELREVVAEGYRRLAFGPVGDAVRLMMAEEEPLDYGELDLFNLAEMKRGKGTMELKFADRLEALDRLARLCREEYGGGGDDAFYQALSQGARGFYRKAEEGGGDENGG